MKKNRTHGNSDSNLLRNFLLNGNIFVKNIATKVLRNDVSDYNKVFV